MADYTFWVPLFITLIATVATIIGAVGQWRGVHLMKQQIQEALEAASTPRGKTKAAVQLPLMPTPPKWYKIYLPHLIMLGLIIALWIPWMANSRHKDHPPVMVGWGSTDPRVCTGMVNGAALTPKFERYNLILVCGIDDGTVDKFEDTRISVSNPYNIRAELLNIVIAVSPQMGEGISKITGHPWPPSNIPIPAPSPKKGNLSIVALPIPEWYETAVIPKGTNLGDIRKLSDISRVGGFVLSRLTIDDNIRLILKNSIGNEADF
jgi:hypothetical protein